jgi:hypothetical protein
MDIKDFEDKYVEFTVQAINGTFYMGFKEGSPRRIPFMAKNEDINWLDKVCEVYKKEYNEEIEYYFENNLCYFKEKN